MNKIGVGIIGCGEMAEIHAKILSEIENVKIQGVYDKNAVAAQHLSKIYKTKCHDSLNDFFSDSRIQVVYVLTRTSSHIEPVLTSLNHGKHVFCEKPVSIRFEDTAKIFNAVKSTGKFFMVGYNLRWTPGAQTIVKNLSLKDHYPVLINLNMSYPPFMNNWLGKPNEGGGVIIVLGSHVFDLIRFIGKSKVTEICCYSEKFRLGAGYAEDSAVAILRFDNRSIATAIFHDNATKSYSFEPGYQMLNVDVYSKMSISSKAMMGSVVFTDDHQETTTSEPYERIRSWGYEAEDKHFIECITTNTKPIPDENDGLWAAILMEAARRSIENKCNVDIESVKIDLEKKYGFNL